MKDIKISELVDAQIQGIKKRSETYAEVIRRALDAGIAELQKERASGEGSGVSEGTDKNTPNGVYLVDNRFCEIVRKRLAKVMGMAASIDDDKAMEIMDELATIRGWFLSREFRERSNKIRDELDMDKLLNPYQPL